MHSIVLFELVWCFAVLSHPILFEASESSKGREGTQGELSCRQNCVSDRLPAGLACHADEFINRDGGTEQTATERDVPGDSWAHPFLSYKGGNPLNARGRVRKESLRESMGEWRCTYFLKRIETSDRVYATEAQ